MGKYEIIIWWSKEDNCYLADVPELPGCMADGESLSDVTKAVDEAIKLWIEVNQARGVEIPEPKGRFMFA
jgi:predicted RNase H-like HicB family nuclease